MKRFYTKVRVSRGDDGFSILLDERPMRTPAKRSFGLPTMSLSEAVAEEWDAQSTEIDPATMPLTRHAYTAIDGGVHRYFGDYGVQAGDGAPTTSRMAAQGQIVTATVALLQSM